MNHIFLLSLYLCGRWMQNLKIIKFFFQIWSFIYESVNNTYFYNHFAYKQPHRSPEHYRYLVQSFCI
jgi:hypothetical protein